MTVIWLDTCLNNFNRLVQRNFRNCYWFANTLHANDKVLSSVSAIVILFLWIFNESQTAVLGLQSPFSSVNIFCEKIKPPFLNGYSSKMKNYISHLCTTPASMPWYIDNWKKINTRKEKPFIQGLSHHPVYSLMSICNSWCYNGISRFLSNCKWF